MCGGSITTEWQRSRFKETNRGISDRQAPSEITARAFDSILGKARNINKLFFSFLKKFNRYLPVNRAALVIYSGRDRTLKVIALKGETAREGLALTLPVENSLLHRVYSSRATYTASQPFYFSGNFIERKILLSPDTKAVMVAPLFDGGDIFGLICISSPREAAFENCDQGVLDKVFRKLGIVIGDMAPVLNI